MKDYRPKQYYNIIRPVPVAPSSTTNVYFRNEDGTLGLVRASTADYKEARLGVREMLVAEGDCLTNKAVLAVIEGGKK
jgi:hypothetical protein